MRRKTRGWLKKIRAVGKSDGRAVLKSRNHMLHSKEHEQKAGKEIKAQEPWNEKQQHQVYLFKCKKSVSPVINASNRSSIENNDNDLWEQRKQLVIHLAKRRNGKVKLREVAAECNVNIRIASDWLKRLALEGLLSFIVGGQKSTIVYALKEVQRS
ncbi:hypothetical protein [Paenibacillus sp. N3.4]|uniref:hypothetical protein n=1 Tax=Paenibacillus sp. N3.4 TaxID=2603222 RepID=UPI0011C8801C|nr:hypothetical protein [Paenibacillus sp. N3.4]TXK71825.1 hypothetical protein FU659_32280 [Paenibacillus sp. N3.4]